MAHWIGNQNGWPTVALNVWYYVVIARNGNKLHTQENPNHTRIHMFGFPLSRLCRLPE